MIPRLPRLLLAALLALQAFPAGALEKYAGGPVVAELVTRLLEQTHYARRPIDDAVSRQHLRNFIESFDYNHMILDKSDVDEFEAKYATTLDDRLREGDVEPAYEIFERVVKRLEERVELVKRLTAEQHDFAKDESAVLDRHELPWPAGKAESDELWRLRIKNEILQERLNRAKAKETVAKSTAPAPKETPIKEVVDQRYERLLRSYKENEGIDVFEAFVSALTRVFDPHTDYLAAAQKENFDISMKLSLVGIGAVLRTEDGYARIVSLVPGGPADLDKRLKPDDKVEAVAQGDGPFVEVVGMKLDRLVQMIRGEKGTTVRLRVIPHAAADPAERSVIALVRDEIKLTDQEAKAKIYTLPGKNGRQAKVGVLDLPSFYADMRGGDGAKSATRDSERLIVEMKKRGVDAIIVDLRRDGGGALTEAVSLSGLFIKEGPVVQVKDYRGTIKLLRDNDPSISYDGALVVLASRGSASASEIFAGAMQDYGRGVVVGEKSTFGKGTVQSVLELNQYLPPAYRSYKPGALKLTIQKFYRVNGASTQHRGVLPDIHLPYYGDLSESIESEQKNALPYDEVEPAPYRPDAGVAARVAALAKASEKRLSSSREFRWIQDDLKRLEKQRKNKSLSLNESKRLAERKADEDRLAARKKERAAKPEKPFASEEITLASLDGTAPPAASTSTAKGSAAADEEPHADESAPDAVLDEALRVAADLAAIAPAPGPSVARGAVESAR